MNAKLDHQSSWKARALDYWIKSHQGVLPGERDHAKIFDREIFNHAEDDAVLKILAALLPPEARKLLDVGSGLGDFALHASERGWNVDGCENDPAAVDLANERGQDRPGRVRFLCADGNQLPFQEGTFDAVTCVNVLEHLSCPEDVIGECARVLKTQGVLLILAPNYLVRFFEPHYQVPWLPFLPRAAARLYLRGLGRNPSFLNQVHYVTHGRVVKIMKNHGLRVQSVQVLKLKDPRLIDNLFIRRWVQRFQGLGLGWCLERFWPAFLSPVICVYGIKMKSQGS